MNLLFAVQIVAEEQAGFFKTRGIELKLEFWGEETISPDGQSSLTDRYEQLSLSFTAIPSLESGSDSLPGNGWGYVNLKIRKSNGEEVKIKKLTISLYRKYWGEGAGKSENEISLLSFVYEDDLYFGIHKNIRIAEIITRGQFSLDWGGFSGLDIEFGVNGDFITLDSTERNIQMNESLENNDYTYNNNPLSGISGHMWIQGGFTFMRNFRLGLKIGYKDTNISVYKHGTQKLKQIGLAKNEDTGVLKITCTQIGGSIDYKKGSFSAGWKVLKQFCDQDLDYEDKDLEDESQYVGIQDSRLYIEYKF